MEGDMERKYGLAELEALETLSVAQADDLKVDEGSTRIWLSRCGLEDGAEYDNMVTVEKYNGQRWDVAEQYQAI